MPRRSKHIVPAVGATLALALCVPGAEAATQVDRAKVEEVAAAHWPGAPCQGRYDVRWEPLAVVKAAWPDAPHIEGYVGEIGPGDCSIHIAADASPGDEQAARLCTLLAHEMGHRAGHKHVEIPGHLMAAAGNATTPLCDRAFPKIEWITVCKLATRTKPYRCERMTTRRYRAQLRAARAAARTTASRR